MADIRNVETMWLTPFAKATVCVKFDIQQIAAKTRKYYPTARIKESQKCSCYVSLQPLFSALNSTCRPVTLWGYQNGLADQTF
jgi:hypothetical protein